MPTLTPDASLADAFRLMESEGLEDVAVVDVTNRRRILGTLSRGDLTQPTTGWSRGSAPSPRPPGSASPSSTAFRTALVPVPGRWTGRALREIDCRARYGITVLAVQRAGGGGEAYELPDPDRPLAPGNRLVLAGSADALRDATAA